MKAVMLYTGSGPLVVLTSHGSVTDPDLIDKLKRKGVEKFMAYELPIDKVEARYGGHFNAVMHNLRESDDLRVLDFDGQRAFRLFRFDELGPAILYEGDSLSAADTQESTPAEGHHGITASQEPRAVTRKEQIARLEGRLQEWDIRIGKLEAMMEEGDRKLRACCQQELEMLLGRRREAGETLADLRLAEAESWEEANLRTLGIFDEMGNSLDTLFSRMRNEAARPS